MKLPIDQVISDYFIQLGNTTLLQKGGYPGDGGKDPGNVFRLKNQKIFSELV
jgi:hypothetical protein